MLLEVSSRSSSLCSSRSRLFLDAVSSSKICCCKSGFVSVEKSGFRVEIMGSVGASFSVPLTVCFDGEDKRLRHIAEDASYRSLGVFGVSVFPFSIILGLTVIRRIAGPARQKGSPQLLL